MRSTVTRNINRLGKFFTWKIVSAVSRAQWGGEIRLNFLPPPNLFPPVRPDDLLRLTEEIELFFNRILINMGQYKLNLGDHLA